MAGLVGNLLSQTPTLATYQIPPLITADIQSTYKLLQPTLLTSNAFTTLVDTGASSPATNVFDDNFQTGYKSSAAQCYVGFDVGTAVTLNLTKIRFFPNPTWANTAKYLTGAIF